MLIQGPYDSEPQVSGVTVGTGAPLEGTLTHIEDSVYWVWRPGQPLSSSSSSLDAGTSDPGDGQGMSEVDVSDESPAGKGGSDGCSVSAAGTSGRTAFALCGWGTLLATGIAARLRRRQARAKVCQGGA